MSTALGIALVLFVLALIVFVIDLLVPSGGVLLAEADPRSLVVSLGVAESEFLPTGSVRIGDRSFEAISEVGLIEAGQEVKVTRLDVGRLVVVPTKKHSDAHRPMSEGSALDQPGTDLGLDAIQ